MSVRPGRNSASLPLLTVALLVFHTGATAWFLRHPEWIEQAGFIPAEPQIHTLFTSLVVHASWLHWLKNALFLGLFGWYVERALGMGRFLTLYLLSGIGAVLVHWGMTLIVQPSLYHDSLVGASGAISGLVGYFALRFYHRRVRLVWSSISQWGLSVPMWVAVLLWIAWQGVGAILDAGSATPSEVGYWAHLGGFACGFLLALLWGAGFTGEREYLMERADACLQQGDAGEALRWLEPLLRKQPLSSLQPATQEDARLLTLAGKAWALLGEYEQARSLLARALQYWTSIQNPDYTEVIAIANLLAEVEGLNLLPFPQQERLLALAESHDDMDTAIRWLRSLLQDPQHPQRPNLLLRLARLQERAGYPQEAQQTLQELVRHYPDSLQADLARLHKRG